MFSRPLESRPKLQRWLLIVLLALTSTALLLGLLYWRATHLAQRVMESKLRIAKDRVDTVLQHMDQQLNQLALDQAVMDQASLLRQMQKMEYNDIRIREVGLLNERAELVLTNLGPVNPPIPVEAKDRPDSQKKTMQVVGKVFTIIMRENSILLGLPTQGEGCVNVLIDPIVLTYFIESVELGETGFIAFLRLDGQILAKIGPAPNRDGFLASEEFPKGIELSTLSADNHVRIIVSMDPDRITDFWLIEASWTLPIMFLMNLALFWLGQRWTKNVDSIQADFTKAIIQRQLRLEYQPIVQISSGQVIGFEALLRWRHPNYGELSPAVFIPLAEETGAIHEVTQWVLQEIHRDHELLLNHCPDGYISVNFPASFLQTGFASTVLEQWLTTTTLTPRQIMIEITEGQLLGTENQKVHQSLDRLEDLGFRLALDDFGTGYSNLSYLHRYRFQYLKVDRSFLPKDPGQDILLRILESVVELANKLGLELIVEGVETPFQAVLLARRGINLAQGWLYSRSLSAKQVAEFLAKPPLALDRLG